MQERQLLDPSGRASQRHGQQQHGALRESRRPVHVHLHNAICWLPEGNSGESAVPHTHHQSRVRRTLLHVLPPPPLLHLPILCAGLEAVWPGRARLRFIFTLFGSHGGKYVIMLRNDHTASCCWSRWSFILHMIYIVCVDRITFLLCM